MRALFEGLIDLLFPPECCHCGRWLLPRHHRDAVLCESCRFALPWIPTELCIRCQDRPPRGRHATCARCTGPSLVLSTTAAVRYEGDIPDWIRRMKYPEPGTRGLDPAPLAVARLLAREAARRCPAEPPDAVVAVPLHRRRFAERGFNPAAIAAHDVARAIGRPFEARILLRTRETPSQTDLDRPGRRRNVAAAFQPHRRCPARIWLVDDVVTTGATLSACALALQLAGAREVDALCLARTPPPEAQSSRR